MHSAASADRGAAPVPHLAARAEDALHAFRERRGRQRGRIATIIPFPGYGGEGWIRVLCRVVLQRPGTTSPGPLDSIRGWRSFTSVPVGDARVIVRAGGTETEVVSDRGGVVDARIGAALDPGWQTIELRVEDRPPVEARVFVVDPSVDFGVVSDIDDTVMVTALPRPLLAAWNTFVLDEHARQPVPGMAVLYDRLHRAHPGAPLVYLSTGAWNVAPTLTRFLTRNLYPAGPLLLTDWGPTHTSWFRSGSDHKRDSLRRLAADFPKLRWLLVGDDGQHDPDLYGDFATADPDRVAAIAIRTLTPSQAVLAGGRAARDGQAPVPRVSAPDGAGLAEKLAELGVV
jgi:phosphatidate phosphatase APP1